MIITYNIIVQAPTVSIPHSLMIDNFPSIYWIEYAYRKPKEEIKPLEELYIWYNHVRSNKNMES